MAGEFERYFREYALAYDSFEPERVASFFHCSCLMVNNEFVSQPTTEHAILSNMRALLAYHRAQGYGSASVADLRVEHQAENLATVRVRWRVADPAGDPLLDWFNTYNLVDYGAGWRILVSITHESAVAEHGA